MNVVKQFGPLVAIVLVLGSASVAVGQADAPATEHQVASPSIEQTLANNALGGGASALTSLAMVYFFLRKQGHDADAKLTEALKRISELDDHVRKLQVDVAELRAIARRD